MNKLIKLTCFLFSLLFSVTASPDIAHAEDATSTLPLADAGMSAYVKLDSIDLTTFENAKAYLFDSVESFDTGYMTGLKNSYAYGTSPKTLVPLHIYLRTDGWLVIYLASDLEPSRIVNWSEGASLEDNLLKLAIDDAVGKLGASYDNSSIKYYDFAHPDAAKMTLVRENVSNATSASRVNTFTALVPGTIYQASYALATFGGGLNSYTKYASLFIDGQLVVNVGDNPFIYGVYDSSYFTAGVSHEIKLSKNTDQYPASAATLILYSAN